jgi:hypothetical protein
MSQKIDDNFNRAIANVASTEVITEHLVKKTKAMIAEITKITQLLMVVARTLLSSRPISNVFLIVDDVQQDLIFIQKLWVKHEQGLFEKAAKKWETKIHKALTLQIDTQSLCQFAGNTEKKMEMCFHLLHDWIAEKYASPLQRTDSPKRYIQSLTEVFCKLTYFSIYEGINRNIDAKLKRKTEKRKVMC